MNTSNSINQALDEVKNKYFVLNEFYGLYLGNRELPWQDERPSLVDCSCVIEDAERFILAVQSLKSAIKADADLTNARFRNHSSSSESKTVVGGTQ